MALNLERQLLFYGAYHNDPCCNSGPVFPVPEALSIEYLPANVGTIGAFLYAVLYVLLEPVAGGSFAPFVIGSAVCGNYLLEHYGSTVNYYAGVFHVISWIAQFVGHGKFEGRAPALLDNLVQALFLAPLFVWIKILFFFGYRSELKHRMDEKVAIEVQKFRKEQEDRKPKGKVAK